ncbi:gliding motility-associated C-terminal domain-containing protein [Fulvivirga sp.]|uniref:T9SS type B sorting domain-containing protein n=1 Tax=Fulvivirga sp. TaxID=1931237 RepID=UPI0032F088A8
MKVLFTAAKFTLSVLLILPFYSYSQCLEESQVLIPEKVLSKSNLYGGEMSSYNDYLLTSASINDSLEFDGGLVYLYKLFAGEWEKIAELAPSEPNLQMFFGRKVVISDNIIIVAGNTFTPEGYHFDELFIYTKDDSEEWVNSTESFKHVIRDDLNNVGLIVNQLVIHDDILGVSYYTSTENIVSFYNISADGSLNHINSLNAPKDQNNRNGSFGIDFDFNENYVAVGASEYYYEPYSRGTLFVYNWIDVVTQADPAPAANLKPRTSDQQNFGVQVEVLENVIFASNGYYYAGADRYETNIYVFKKPISGWLNRNESAILSLGVNGFYGYRNTLRVSDQYVFLSRSSYGENTIYGFKKTGVDWGYARPTIVFHKEKEEPTDTRYFASSLEIFEDHVVASYIDGNSSFYPDSQDELISYNTPGGIYEKIGDDEHQRISEITYSASEAVFGESMSYSNNRLAVGVVGDKKNGQYAGAVYIYDRNQATEDYDLSAVIRSPDKNPYDNFGYRVELSDSLLFVSSVFYDSLDTDGSYIQGSIGKVYQYISSGGSWQLQNTIYSPADLFDDDNVHFGRSLSYSDNYLAVSQYYTGSSESNGAVHIFERTEANGWNPVAEMRTSEQMGGDFFGRKVIMRDSLLVVGTGNPEYGSTDEMRVYIFTRKGEKWESGTEAAYLSPSDKRRFDRFGFSFDLHRDLIVVGSPQFNYGNTKNLAGKAYIFKKPDDGWSGRINESLMLEPANPMEEDFFGYDVMMDDNQILVGAASSINNPASIWYTSDIPDLQPGKLYFFDPYSGQNQGDIANERYIQLSPNNRYLDGFGYLLEKSFDRVFVTATYDNNESGFRAGGVYNFKYTTYIYGIEEPICVDESPFKMKSNILGGIWSGQGITDENEGWFDPSRIPENSWTLVSYTAGDCTVSTSLFVGSSPELISKSDDKITKCADDISLFVNYSSESRTLARWYYKESSTDSYQFLKSGIDTIAVSLSGYYKVEVENSSCRPLALVFEVEEEKLEVELSHENQAEICSYANEILSLVTNEDLQGIEWHYGETYAESFNLLEASEKIPIKASGYYFSIYRTEHCSYTSDTIYLNYNHLEIDIVEPETICSYEPYQLQVSPEEGLWYGSGVSNTGLVNTYQLSEGIHSSDYKIIQGGCVFSKSVEFEVLLLPRPEIEYQSNEVCAEQPTVLSISNNEKLANVSWFKEGNAAILDSTDTYSADMAGDFFAMFDSKGCQTISDTVTLYTKQDSLYVPNVITNNDDGVNDYFEFYYEGTNDINLTIFNRWGDKVYFDEGEELKWRPENQSSGVYYWQINYHDCYKAPQSLKGWVQLLND